MEKTVDSQIIDLTVNNIKKILIKKYIGYIEANVEDDMLEVTIDNGLYVYYYYRPDYISYVTSKGTDSIIDELNKEYILDQHSRFYK